ncbi:MAG: alpha/beta hydrolase [Gemmatimonadales bacterium]
MSRSVTVSVTLAAITVMLAGGSSVLSPSGRGPAHLSARPAIPSRTAVAGLTHLALESGRDAILYVPPGTAPGTKLPFILLLHGATMRPESQLSLLQGIAESRGIALLAVKSLDYTWDAIRGEYGPDIAFIDRALKEAFGSVLIDPSRVAVEGFSDGASYALALALSNGDLFSRAIAFSAGFIPPFETQGKPRVFISHGIADRILPIDRAGRSIAGQLRSAGYQVDYREFDGPHTVPLDIATAAVDWFLLRPAGR